MSILYSPFLLCQNRFRWIPRRTFVVRGSRHLSSSKTLERSTRNLPNGAPSKMPILVQFDFDRPISLSMKMVLLWTFFKPMKYRNNLTCPLIELRLLYPQINDAIAERGIVFPHHVGNFLRRAICNLLPTNVYRRYKEGRVDTLSQDWIHLTIE